MPIVLVILQDYYAVCPNSCLFPESARAAVVDSEIVARTVGEPSQIAGSANLRRK
jgi:hypothetical protein